MLIAPSFVFPAESGLSYFFGNCLFIGLWFYSSEENQEDLVKAVDSSTLHFKVVPMDYTSLRSCHINFFQLF